MPKDVHPQIQDLIDKMNEYGIPKVQDLDPKSARALVETMSAARRKDFPSKPMAEIENTSTGPGFGHVPVRIYRNSDAPNAPSILFFHGGGHVLGSLESYDTLACFLATASGCTLISVDYRMGPEHPFPAAVEDCFDATRWASENATALRIDPAKIAVCGDSAGGNLAAVVALMARDASIPIAAQVLVYPVIDYRGGTPSYDRYGKGYGVLEADTVSWFMDRYLPDAATRDDWRACPRNAASHANLPPTLLVTAECDVLYHEGSTYGAQLQSADVPVEHVDFPGMTHGFFGYLGLVDAAETAHQTVADFLKRTL